MTTIRDREFTESVTANGAGVEFVGCTFRAGLYWFGSGAGSVRECIFHAGANNHGLYTHNTGGGVREIDRCLFMPYPGRFGLHIYSGGANWLKDYKVTNCVHLAPVQVGGGYGVHNLIYQKNTHISTHAGFGTYAGAVTNTGEITGNRFVNPSGVEIVGGFTCRDNDYMTVTARAIPRGFSLVALPHDWSTVILFSEAARWDGIEARCVNGVASARVIERKRHGHGALPMVDALLFGLAAVITFRGRQA